MERLQGGWSSLRTVCTRVAPGAHVSSSDGNPHGPVVAPNAQRVSRSDLWGLKGQGQWASPLAPGGHHHCAAHPGSCVPLGLSLLVPVSGPASLVCAVPGLVDLVKLCRNSEGRTESLGDEAV